MNRLSSLFLSLLGCLSSYAIDNNTVEIVYNGSTASITVASNISSYVSISSGTSSHVKLIQAETFAGVDPTVDNEEGEIIYVLSGNSSDGSFVMEGAFKATVELNGVTLTNPSGPAIAVMDGKRIDVSAKKSTVNTLTDGANADYNGCFHCKGHTKFKGKGTLNIIGNSKHGVYSKEYIEIKNLTLNVTAAAKDGIHCKEYFLMESGTVSISEAQDDGIQVELSGATPTAETIGHEDEDSGNFYMAGGTLTISSYQEKAIKTAGTISYSGGTQNFDKTDTEENVSAINTVKNGTHEGITAVYDLNGRRLSPAPLAKGLLIMKKDGKVMKVVR